MLEGLKFESHQHQNGAGQGCKCNKETQRNAQRFSQSIHGVWGIPKTSCESIPGIYVLAISQAVCSTSPCSPIHRIKCSPPFLLWLSCLFLSCLQCQGGFQNKWEWHSRGKMNSLSSALPSPLLLFIFVYFTRSNICQHGSRGTASQRELVFFFFGIKQII